MKITEKSTEFMVDSSIEESSYLRMQGACNMGTLNLGDTFIKAYKHELEQEDDGGYHVSRQFNERDVALTIEKIRAYGHDIDELVEGMTGELLLSGQGSELIEKDDLLGMK